MLFSIARIFIIFTLQSLYEGGGHFVVKMITFFLICRGSFRAAKFLKRMVGLFYGGFFLLVFGQKIFCVSSETIC